MANVIKTVITYPLNGSTRDFQIPFEYLARKFVQVTLIGRDRKELINIQDYRFTSKTQITTNQTWGVGDGYELIELRRFTSATDRLVDFADGSILRAYDLNVSQIQTLHVAEEARDLTADTIGVNNEGHLDARGRRIVNVADPVNALDAVNLKTIREWNDGAYQSYIKAKAEADRAAQAAAGAKTSETNSYSHMTQAGFSEQRAKASEVAAAGSQSAAANSAANAANSAGSASSSAQQATDAKDYTKQQADRSYNEAERAKGYADSMGNAIDIGGTIRQIQGNDVMWKGSHYTTQFFGVRGDLGDWGGVGINLEARIGGSPTIAVVKGGNWKYYGFDMDNAGTLATKEYTNQFIGKTIGGGSQLQAPGGTNTIAVNPNGNCGIWDPQGNRWMLRANTTGATDLTKDLYLINQDSGSNSTKVEIVSPDSGKRTGLWAYNDGRILLSAYHTSSGWSNISLGGVGNGTIALREWVSANFSNGTKLGGIVRGTKVNLSSEVRDQEIMNLLSQIPENAVCCGFDRSSTGGFLALIPRWRVITSL